MHLRYPTQVACLLLFSILFMAQPSWAGKVVKVKGKKVYIMLEQDELDSVFKGDSLYLTTEAGKKRGLVIVRKMRGRKVIAQLKKGKAATSMLTLNRKGKKKKKKREEEMVEPAGEVAETETESRGRSDMMLGVMLGFGTATQNVTDVADMSGSTTAIKGVFDYELFSGLGVKARVGMEMLSVSGTNLGTNYNTDINYLTVDLLMRYYLYRGESFGFFGNLGMGIYSPMSTDLGTPGGEALEEDSISTTSLLIGGVGLSVPFSGWEVQLGVDYHFFPPSDDVETSVISGKLGVLFEI